MLPTCTLKSITMRDATNAILKSPEKSSRIWWRFLTIDKNNMNTFHGFKDRFGGGAAD